MENKYRQLCQSLAEVNEALRATAPGDVNSPEKENLVPAIETIDFDKLTGLIQQAVGALNQACEQEKEGEIARDWFVRRIESFRKTRQALLSEVRPPDAGQSLERAALPELIRLYEEASAALKGLAGNRGRQGRQGAFATADEVRQFKS